MNMLLPRTALVLSLGLSAVVGAAGCSSDNSTDTTNGKAISDIDIGGDVTVDKGATKQLSATVKYADGTTLDVTSNAALVWNVDNTDVATVSSAGLLTGTGVGATKVKATYQGSESGSHAVIVH